MAFPTMHSGQSRRMLRRVLRACRALGRRPLPAWGEVEHEQPGTWVTVLTGDMGNTFPVLFRSVAVAPVDPVGNAQRCPQVHRPEAWVYAGDHRHAR
jgi:hypothetical protein